MRIAKESTFYKSRSTITLVVIVMLMGIGFLQAKRPPKLEEPEWSVTIPGFGGDSNLFADTEEDQQIYDDTGSSFVRVQRSGSVPYSLRFALQTDAVPQIGFKELALYNSGMPVSGECACNFPNLTEEQKGTLPQCMEDFLLDNFHPYTGIEGSYQSFWLSIDVNYDLDSIPEGDTVYPSGTVLIQITYSDTVLSSPCDNFHSIVMNCDSAGILAITREGNSWTVAVNDPATRITEAYLSISGKGKGKIESMKPIRAISQFQFTTTWTRN